MLFVMTREKQIREVVQPYCGQSRVELLGGRGDFDYLCYLTLILCYSVFSLWVIGIGIMLGIGSQCRFCFDKSCSFSQAGTRHRTVEVKSSTTTATAAELRAGPSRARRVGAGAAAVPTHLEPPEIGVSR